LLRPFSVDVKIDVFLLATCLSSVSRFKYDGEILKIGVTLSMNKIAVLGKTKSIERSEAVALKNRELLERIFIVPLLFWFWG